MTTIDAILPAGGRISGEFADEVGANVKALIEIDGRTVLERTIDTLRATGRIGRAVVIGSEEVAAHPASRCADWVLPEGGHSGPANIISGIQWLREANGGAEPDRVLLVTTDLPFLTPECLLRYLDSCPREAHLCAPLVSREAFEARFPESQTFYAKLSDGQWTLGCAFLVHPAAVNANRELIERFFQARKNQMALAQLLGIGFILKFLAGTLTVRDIERQCRDAFGCRACAVPDSPPELAFDIDRVEDYRYALKTQAGHSQPGAPSF